MIDARDPAIEPAPSLAENDPGPWTDEDSKEMARINKMLDEKRARRFVEDGEPMGVDKFLKMPALELRAYNVALSREGKQSDQLIFATLIRLMDALLIPKKKGGGKRDTDQNGNVR